VSEQREADLMRVYEAIDAAQQINNSLQVKIASFLHTPGTTEVRFLNALHCSNFEVDRSNFPHHASGCEFNQGDDNHPAEGQRRFAKLVQQWCKAAETLEHQKVEYNTVAMELQQRLDDKETKASEIKESFDDFKREITKSAENSRTGKKIPPKLIAQFEADGRRKNEEVERMRITDIKLRMQLRKVSKSLKQKEELQEGVHLIDFEQLKIENQTLSEKIEERNEEVSW